MSQQIPLNPLRTFVAVASRLSFAAGAEVLNVILAAVSSQIRALEEQLGVSLFVRQGRKVSLTEAGRMLLPGVQSGLAQINAAVKSLAVDRETGVLNVSMLASFLQKWLTPRLHEFYQRYPDVDLRINADMAPVNFQETDFHAAIRFGKGNYPGLASKKLLDDWMVPVCSPALLEKYGPLERLEDLSRYPLLHSVDEPWDCWIKGLGGVSDNRRGPTFDDAVNTAVAAEQGLGVGLARWSLIASELEQGKLVRPIDVVSKSEFAYYFVAPKHYFELPKLRNFRLWLEECCRQFSAPL